MGRRRGRRGPATAFALVVLLAGGCQTVATPRGGDEPEPAVLPEPEPDREPAPAVDVVVTGQYRGYLWVEGEPLVASLILNQSGVRVDGRLDSEAGVSGSGQGDLSGFALLLQIPYETACAGQMALTGNISSDGSRFEGTFRAEDCTGATTGRFDFRRP